MRVLYLNNAGGGFADYIDVEPGTTVEKFFSQKMPSNSEADYLIRVNRQPVARNQMLQENDRVSITPTKIEGARIA
ncbi:MAG TPA: molybdopterin converting factor [Phycisphaerae bacterium]|nr:molybdopterin converting factor [Phycisphaerae bacterium]